MSAIESTPSTNGSVGFGQIIDSPPEVLAEISRIREEEHVTRHREEIDSRFDGGVEVKMFLVKGSDQIVVEVNDHQEGGTFELEVDREKAADVYHHPFAYAGTGYLATRAAVAELPKAS